MTIGAPFVDTIEQAVRRIALGNRVALGGARLCKKPMALVRELIRQGTGDLEIMTSAASIECDMLIAAGLARQITFSFFNIDIVGMATNFRKKVEAGELKTLEFGTLAMIRSLEAAERDIPFNYARSMIGSDLVKHHPGQHKMVGDQLLLEVPAYQPDVALLHVPYADVNGNALIVHEGFDFHLAKAAKRCVVSVDRILPRDEFCREIGTELPAKNIDAVVVVPFGAHPTSCYPHYVQDYDHVLEYYDACTDGRIDDYLQEQIRSNDENDYQQKVGLARFHQLQRMMDMSRAVVSGK